MSVLVLDNGSYEIKAGRANSAECFHVKNALMRSRDRRLWLANAVDMCKDLTGLQYKRPVERGQLYTWELEKVIWDWMWDTKKIVQSEDEFRDMTLLLTESPGSLPSMSTNTDQVVFEEYEFANYRRCPPQVLAACTQPHHPEASLVVDLGFNATYVVPVVKSINAVQSGITRLDVGGKVLTNYLKEIVSYRHYNMMEETSILNRIKEKTCFVSLDFDKDLESWHADHLIRQFSKFAIGYALPDSHEDAHGHVIEDVSEAQRLQKSGENQVLVLENERFSVPEALFDPLGHLGIDQAPLPETIANSVLSCPELCQPLLWSNIVICGGTSNLKNSVKRIEKEIRRFAPADVPVRVFTSENRTETAWEGGCKIAENAEFLDAFTVSRATYLEQGPSFVQRKFAANNKWNSKNGPALW